MIDILIDLFATLLLIRLLVPNTGQMYFNRPFQWIVKITEPFCRLPLAVTKGKVIAFSPAVSFTFFILLKALLHAGGYHIFFFSGKEPLSSHKGAFLMYTSVGFLSAVHFSFTSYLKFLFQSCMFMFFAVLASHSQRVTNHILFILHHFLRAMADRLIPARLKTGIYEKPLLFLLSLLFIFAFFFTVLFLAGEKIGLFALPYREASSFLIWLSLVMSVMSLNVIKILLPLLLIRIVLSWFFPSRTMLYQILEALTDPVLEPFKKLPLQAGAFDFSPLIAFFAVSIFFEIVSKFLNNLFLLL
ncbi:MAG: YggT family protein [Candidatus Aureabacteria bacterium]|nr:YggT family protein [Candidatus Auribacterota bacterium]